MSALPHDNTLPELLRMEATASEELDASNSSIQVMRCAWTGPIRVSGG